MPLFDLKYYLDRTSEKEPPLYKFRSCRDENHTKNLADGKLWITNALELNDPFDSKPQQFLLTRDELRKQTYIEKIKNTGMISFTGKLAGASSTEEGGASHSGDLLLWSHYADGHRGFCMVLRDEYLYRKSSPVEYPATYPNLDDVAPEAPDLWEKIGYFKSTEWRYENERRVRFDDKVDTYYDLPSGAIFAILFGCWSVNDRRNSRLSPNQKTRSEIAQAVLKHSPQCLFFLARIIQREFRVAYDYITPEFRRC